MELQRRVQRKDGGGGPTITQKEAVDKDLKYLHLNKKNTAIADKCGILMNANQSHSGDMND